MEIGIAPINPVASVTPPTRTSLPCRKAMRRRWVFFTVPALIFSFAAAAGAADVSAGQALFASHCARCHGDDGRGKGTMMGLMAAMHITPRPLDFTDAAAMKNWTDSELVAIISQGGKATGHSSVMPEYGDKLSSQDIANLVAYIHSLQK